MAQCRQARKLEPTPEVTGCRSWGSCTAPQRRQCRARRGAVRSVAQICARPARHASGAPAQSIAGARPSEQVATAARAWEQTVAASEQKPHGAAAVGHMLTQTVKFGVLAGSPLIGMHWKMADVACEH